MCSSGGTLRIPLSAAGQDGSDEQGTEGAWWHLPTHAQDALARRGLLVPTDEPFRRHPSYQGSSAPPGPIRVFGDDRLSAAITSYLHDTGIDTVPGSCSGSGAQASVLSLAAPEDELRTATETAIEDRAPIVVHAHTPATLFLAVLRPPDTACPLCLVERVRALWPGRDIADAPLEILLGLCSDAGWPSSKAAIGLITHHTVRALGGTDTEPANPDRSPVAELLELDLDTLDRRQHPVLHLPSCPACAPHVDRTPQPLDLHAPNPALGDCWERMRNAVDPLTGIVSGVDDRQPVDAGVALAWTTHGTDTTRFSAARASTTGGAAKHDPLQARVCALGEALERYAGGVYPPSGFVRASLTELGEEAVDPRELPLGSPAEYRSATSLAPYRPDLVIDWVAGTEPDTGRRRYVPACAVHVPYHAPHRSERLMNPISTGLAAGSTPAQALRAGLLEVVERDAFALYWYNRLPVPTLDLETLPDSPARTVLDRMRLRGIDVLAKNITTDLDIPTVVLSGRLETPDHCLVLHASRSELDFGEAVQGASEELELGFLQIFSLLENRSAPEDGQELRHMWDFYLYYCRRDRTRLLDWMREGPVQNIPPPEHDPRKSDVDQILARLSARGYRAITIDITPVDSAECGVSVLRSIVPGLQPVTFSQRFRHLGGPRLYQAPVHMGLRSSPLAEDELNPNPLPMA